MKSPYPDEPIRPDWTRNPSTGEMVYRSGVAPVWAVRRSADNRMRYGLRWQEFVGVRRCTREKWFHDKRTMMREFVKKELTVRRAIASGN